MAGIAAGALAIVAGFLVSLPTLPNDPISGLLAATFAGGVVAGSNQAISRGGMTVLAATFAGGVVAGVLSSGGAREGGVSGLLSGVFGFGVLAIWLLARLFIEQASRAGGSGFMAGLALIVLPLMGAVILVIALVGGALGGSLGRLARPRGAKPEL